MVDLMGSSRVDTCYSADQKPYADESLPKQLT